MEDHSFQIFLKYAPSLLTKRAHHGIALLEKIVFEPWKEEKNETKEPDQDEVSKIQVDLFLYW